MRLPRFILLMAKISNLIMGIFRIIKMYYLNVPRPFIQMLYQIIGNIITDLLPGVKYNLISVSLPLYFNLSSSSMVILQLISMYMFL